jgi:uncharacterized membrane protein YfcA
MFVPEEPVTTVYSPGAIKASMWLMIAICAGSWVVFFFFASEDGPWPAVALPLMMTGFLIYGFHRNRNLWTRTDKDLTTPERPVLANGADVFPPSWSPPWQSSWACSESAGHASPSSTTQITGSSSNRS